MPLTKKEIEKLKKWKKLAITASTNRGSSAKLELDEKKALRILDEMHKMCLRHYPKHASYFLHLKRLYLAFATQKISYHYFMYQLNLLNWFYGVRK